MSLKVYREVNGQEVKGRMFPAIFKTYRSILKTDHFYVLVNVFVYEDGKISYEGNLMDLDKFSRLLKSGRSSLRFSVPDGTDLIIRNLGTLKLNSFLPEKTAEDFLKEVDDAIVTMNGGVGRREKCWEAFKIYLLDDSEQNFEALHIAFEALPSHKRMLCENIEHKDPLIDLMKTRKTFSVSSRKWLLDEYFDLDWDESDFVE